MSVEVLLQINSFESNEFTGFRWKSLSLIVRVQESKRIAVIEAVRCRSFSEKMFATNFDWYVFVVYLCASNEICGRIIVAIWFVCRRRPPRNNGCVLCVGCSLSHRQ